MKYRSLLSLMIAIGSVVMTNAVCMASEEASGPVNPMNFQADLALWTAVIFILTLLILGKFAWKPIVEGLDKREAGIADQIAQAETQNAQAKALLDEYKSQLANAKNEVATMVDDAKKNAEKVKQVIIDKAKADAEAEVRKAASQIEQAKKEAIAELANNAADMAINLAGKICQKQLDKNAHSNLINTAVDNFSKQAL